MCPCPECRHCLHLVWGEACRPGSGACLVPLLTDSESCFFSRTGGQLFGVSGPVSGTLPFLQQREVSA